MMRTTTIATILATALPALASHPFDTDDAGTVAVAATELELISTVTKSSGDASIGLKHGLTPRMDIGLTVAHSSWPDSTRAWQGATLGLKFNLVPEHLSISFANEFGTGEYAINGIGSWQKDALGINLNLGGEFTPGARDAGLTWGVNPHHDLGPVTYGVELNGTDESLSKWKLGVQYHATSWMAVAAGFGTALEGDKDWAANLNLWLGL